MVKQKLENVGDVVVEQEAEDVNAFAPDVDANGDVTQQSDATQEEPEEELSNVSASEQEKTLVREKRALLKDVGLIGAAYGAGKTSMISLAERVTEAAMSGSINPKDAEDIYNRFKEKADAKATLDDLTSPVPDAATADKPSQVDDDKSKKQQLSKLRSFIKLGNEYEDDGLDIVRRARNIHLRMLEGDRKAVMQGSTYTILVSVASHQVKDGKGVPMTDDEIEDFLGVEQHDKAPPDGMAKLEAALANAKAAQKGGKERAPIESEHLDRAIQALREAIAEQPNGEERLKAIDEKANKQEEKAAVAAFKASRA
jgi:hypothetical protein